LMALIWLVNIYLLFQPPMGIGVPLGWRVCDHFHLHDQGCEGGGKHHQGVQVSWCAP
jgi:hypothetical protein